MTTLNASPRPLRFPQDIFRFLYWVFFKPITLHRYLHEMIPELRRYADPSLFALWRRLRVHPEVLPVIYLALFDTFVFPFLAFPIAWGLQLAGVWVDWSSVALGVALGVASGVAYGVAFLLGYFRLFLYVIQAPFSFLQNRFGATSLRRSPVVWDEMIWLPLPGLDGLLFKTAQRNRQEGMDAIAFVAGSFKQGWAAKKAMLELTAYDVARAKTLPEIKEIAETLSWLPDDARQELQEFLLGIEQISQHARAALESETLYNRQEQLRMGIQVLERVMGGLAYAEKRGVSRRMLPPLEGWKRVFQAELLEANKEEIIPNVYVSGSPLIKASKTFKGRRDVFRALTRQLVSPAGQRPALLLFGARRMGKTSTLKQLPVQLGPQIVPVSLDIQKIATVEGAFHLLFRFAKEIIETARRERHLKFPLLSEEALERDPFFVFQEWLDSLGDILGDYYWILLALDEFESLGEMFEKGRIDERIFQLLRGIFQNFPRITLLLSGAHTLEELPPYWSDYFINVKMLKVAPLEEADAVELITRPIPDFPVEYEEEALRLLLDETGCHPNWIQHACQEIVERLNEEDRFSVSVSDVQWAVTRVPVGLAGDFKNFWEGGDSTPLMQAILKRIAETGASPESGFGPLRDEPEFQRTLDFLLRRDVLIYEAETYRFRANLLRRWVSAR